jgi:hypothetical protein
LSSTLSVAGILLDKVFAFSRAGTLNYGLHPGERFAATDVARHKLPVARKAMELIENLNLWPLDTDVANDHL